MSYPSVEWIKQQAVMNTTGTDYLPNITVDSTGNMYVTYYTNGLVSGGTNKGSYDIVVFKIDNNGNMIWIQEKAVMNTTLFDYAPKIALDTSGNVYVSYPTDGTVSGGVNSGSYDIVVFKMDTDGNMVWIKEQAVMNSTGNDQLPTIAVDASGNIYVSYQTPGTVSSGTFLGGTNDIVVFKMDTNGNMVWIKQQAVMNSTGNDQNSTIAVDASGNIYVSYQTPATVSSGTFLGGANDIVVFKMDTNGNIVWIKEQAVMNSTGNDQNPMIKVDPSGNVYITYRTTGTTSGGTFLGGNDIVVFKMDTNGNIVWIKEQSVMNTIGTDQNQTIVVDISGNVYVSYQTDGTVSGGTNVGGSDIVVFKLDINGNMVWILEEPLFNTNLDNTYSTIGVDTSGNVYVSYIIDGTVSGGTYKGSLDIVVMKLRQSNTQIVPSVTNVTYSTYNNASVNVNWLSKNGATSIKVYRDTQISGATKTLLGSSSGYTYTDTTLPASGIYYYFISAVYNGVETALSSAYTFNYTMPDVVLSWIKQQAVMNSTNSDTTPAIAFDASGNIYVSYKTSGTVSGGTFRGGTDIVVFKMDTNGNMVWIKQQANFNTTVSDTDPTIAVDTSGNVYVAYNTNGTVSGGTFLGVNDIVLFKLDMNGNIVWIKEQPLTNTDSNDFSVSIAVNSNGNLYVSYYTGGTISGGTLLNGNGSDIVVFNMDTNGNMVWIKQQAVMNTINFDMHPEIALDVSGNIYVSYQTSGRVSGGTFLGVNYDIVVFKMDTNGNMVWIKEQSVMNTTADDYYPKIAIDSSGNVYVSYYTSGTVSGGTFRGGSDIVVFKMDTNGNMVWIKQQANFNTTGNDMNPSIAVDTSGNVYISYQTLGVVSGGIFLNGYEIVLLKMDTNGNTLWIKQEPVFNTLSNEAYTSIAVDVSGNIYVSYTSNGTLSGGTLVGSEDIVVMKYIRSVNFPGAPTAVTATAGSSQAIVAFTAPTNNGGAAITSYTVTSSPGGITATGASSPITVTGLTAGTSYTFTVTATNSAGAGTASVASNAVTPYTLPGAPTNVIATPESLRALVSWTKPASNGGLAITSYTVTSSPGSFTASVNGEDNTSCYVYGLSNGTAYTFTVTATNLAGTGSASAASTGVTPVADAPTTAVTDAVANNNTATIAAYIADAPATTPTEQAALSIDMRVSLNAGTVGATEQQKVDTKLAYIDSMRTKVGADNFTVPQAQFTEFLQTFQTIAAQTFTPKPIVAYVPAYTASTATIDVSSATTGNYVMVEVPIGYTAILQNGAISVSLTYNGTNYTDGTTTYNAGSIIVIGSKTFTLIGIGSGAFDVQNTSAVICIAKGAKIQTPVGEPAIETLKAGDKVLTADGRTAPITKMQQIVVVSANEINAPYIIERNAFGPGRPANRLEVSPRHAIQLRPGLWEIPKEAAKENPKVYQNKSALGKQVIYYHFSLPNYETDTVIANGQATECLNEGNVKESYVWNAAEKGYVRIVKRTEATTLSKH